MTDFTLDSYFLIIDSALEADYQLVTVNDLFDKRSVQKQHIVLRHDVDRRPQNALNIARGESDRGVRSTYYFRIIPSTFKPDIIKAIHELGHEIGYHYEDFHVARYDPKKAFNLFQQHLGALREIAPIKTIVMHGSPMARFNNMELWNHHKFESMNVKDCILSYDWSNYGFFTDTGRSFSACKTNLRDTIGGIAFPEIATSKQLADFFINRRYPRIQFSTHPERWNYFGFDWMRQLITDKTLNAVKLGLSIIR